MAKVRPRHGITACDQQFLEALRRIESTGADACRNGAEFGPGAVTKLMRETEKCYAALRIPAPTVVVPKQRAEESYSGGLIEF